MKFLLIVYLSIFQWQPLAFARTALPQNVVQEKVLCGVIKSAYLLELDGDDHNEMATAFVTVLSSGRVIKVISFDLATEFLTHPHLETKTHYYGDGFRAYRETTWSSQSASDFYQVCFTDIRLKTSPISNVIELSQVFGSYSLYTD